MLSIEIELILESMNGDFFPYLFCNKVLYKLSFVELGAPV